MVIIEIHLLSNAETLKKTPIVSCSNYAKAKYLASTLRTYVNQIESYVKNSLHVIGIYEELPTKIH